MGVAPHTLIIMDDSGCVYVRVSLDEGTLVWNLCANEVRTRGKAGVVMVKGHVFEVRLYLHGGVKAAGGRHIVLAVGHYYRGRGLLHWMLDEKGIRLEHHVFTHIVLLEGVEHIVSSEHAIHPCDIGLQLAVLPHIFIVNLPLHPALSPVFKAHHFLLLHIHRC